MGPLEWIMLGLIIWAAYRQYQTQEYWLDRQVAKLIHLTKNGLDKLFRSIKKGA